MVLYTFLVFNTCNISCLGSSLLLATFTFLSIYYFFFYLSTCGFFEYLNFLGLRAQFNIASIKEGRKYLPLVKIKVLETTF